jgi:formate--tetrahydrofolate ligase
MKNLAASNFTTYYLLLTTTMKTDIEIARETPLLPIKTIANQLDIAENDLEPYGKFKAKLPIDLIDADKIAQSNLILVTAITPTKAGIGKTTTSVGLALGLQKIGKKAIVALREPSLGPCFGMKGGAAGGGYAQVLPMEDINLHFTGDFHAITSAHNMIAALLDNYQYQNRANDKQLKQVVWKRVLDVNDRALRSIVTGLGGNANGVATESGFDITVASEIMAILCLSLNINDLRSRVARIILGYRQDNTAFTVEDLGITGAITVLLKDAIQPNLVQTTENTPAIIHGGPFANIAHGCNSVLATKMALSLGDYVITEAGFGADLGAEKFMNIKCRMAGIAPKATVIVVTSQALKLHAGLSYEEISKPNLSALQSGIANLQRHVENMQAFGQSVVVAFNQYGFDVAQEMDALAQWAATQNVAFAINNSFAKGGDGAVALAQAVVDMIEKQPSKPITYSYELSQTVEEKINAVVQKVYRGNGATLSKKANSALAKIKKMGFAHLPICMAKTQYSFSDNPKLLGAPADFSIAVEDVILNAGAGFIVVVAGDIMRMPGLPAQPQANHIDWVDGRIEGLS